MKTVAERLAEAEKGLGYDDVLLAPRVSSVDPRDVDLSTRIGPIQLQRPVLAASMTAMGSLELFVGVARAGGMAIIPQWPLLRRLALLRAVKSHCAASEQESADAEGRLRVAVSCSAAEVDAAAGFIEAGADALVLESAHAGNMVFLKAAAALRGIVPKAAALIAGNAGAADAAIRLKEAGVDAIKVGVGVGSICTTTEVTGVGMPQASALAEVTDALNGSGIAIIADGGIRTGGDIVKAFAFGAAAVCVGSLFAQSLEAAGDSTVDTQGLTWRKYAANFYPSLAYEQEGRIEAGEGLEGWLPIAGGVDAIVQRLSAAVRVGMAYIGAGTIPEAIGQARFIVPVSSHAADQQRRQQTITGLRPLTAPRAEVSADGGVYTAAQSKSDANTPGGEVIDAGCKSTPRS